MLDRRRRHLAASCAAAASSRNLEDEARARSPPPGTVGIGHTRWATHGRPTRRERASAHGRRRRGRPQRHHREPPGAARASCEARGASSRRETDTEIVAHLIDERAARRRAEPASTAVRTALAQVEGAYALVGRCRDDEPGHDRRRQERVAAGASASARARTSSPRDVPALLDAHARRHLPRGRRRSPRSRATGVEHHRPRRASRSSAASRRSSPGTRSQAEKGGYKHFMLKEIHEQPRAVADTLRGRVDLEERRRRSSTALEHRRREQRRARSCFIACGTCVARRRWSASSCIEELARIPVEVELRQRVPLPRSDRRPGRPRRSRSRSPARPPTRWRRSRRRKAQGAQRARDLQRRRLARSRARRDGALYTHAGPEIGVASTKAFTTQLAALLLLAIHLGRRTRHARRRSAAATLLDELAQHARTRCADVARARRARSQVLAQPLRRRARLPLPRPRHAATRSRSRARSSSRRSRTSTPRATPPAR